MNFTLTIQNSKLAKEMLINHIAFENVATVVYRKSERERGNMAYQLAKSVKKTREKRSVMHKISS